MLAVTGTKKAENETLIDKSEVSGRSSLILFDNTMRLLSANISTGWYLEMKDKLSFDFLLVVDFDEKILPRLDNIKNTETITNK